MLEEELQPIDVPSVINYRPYALPNELPTRLVRRGNAIIEKYARTPTYPGIIPIESERVIATQNEFGAWVPR